MIHLAHTLGSGGPEIEILILAAGVLLLAVIFFFQKSVKPQVPVVLAIGAVALVAGAFAFGGDGGGSSTDARVEIVSPADGATVPANEDLTLEIEIIGGTLTTQTSSADENAGHLHVEIDGSGVTMPMSGDVVIDGEDLTAGQHEIVVEFTKADHSRYDPPVTTTITITAE